MLLYKFLFLKINFQMKSIMKTNIRRINKLPKIEAFQQRASNIPLNQQDGYRTNGSFKNHDLVNTQYLEVLSNIMKQTLKENKKNQLEARDRFVIVDSPEPNEVGQLDDDVLADWITEVCSSVFSSAFNYLTEDKMTYEQTKVFCSQGILKNIFYLTKRHHLTQKQIQLINQHIEEQTVPYMQRKYPLTQSIEVNKLIDSQMKDFDQRQFLQNDYLLKSDILFTYRQSGNYNDLIMKLMNKVITQIDEQNNSSQTTAYQQFYKFTSQMFEKVYSQKWMDGKIQKQENQPTDNKVLPKDVDETKAKEIASNEKYAQKVREYTHYAIGRKLQNNIPIYTQQQIQSGSLVIKNKALLRILTKWCEELWNKFKSKNYFLNRQQNLRVQQIGGNINTLFMWMKLPLNDFMQQEKARIKEFMKKVQENNFDQQSRILISELDKDGFNYIEKHQKACGKFAHKIIKNLHLYVVLYLNRIIHGLLTVAKRMYEQKLSSKARWTSPPDLMSFTIGDIMRCKCSSKQREILKIFQYLKQESNSNPRKIKIIRIKNRLKAGTNDVLINVLFQQKFLCEIQLAVKSVKSKFIQYSNMFSHYIYELGRTLFGPITQLCSIWTSLDPRAVEYLQLVKKQKKKKSIINQPLCSKKGLEHNFQLLSMPFVCSNCKRSYSAVNEDFIYPHYNCINQSCDFYLCGLCRIQINSFQQIKQDILSGQTEQLKLACLSLVNNKPVPQRTIPQYGVCVQILTKKPKVIKFRVFEVQKIKTIFGLIKQQETGQKLIKVKQIYKKDAIQEMLQKYLIFQLSNDYGQRTININFKRVKHQVIIPLKVKQAYKKQSEILSLIDEGLDDKSMQILKGTQQEQSQIRNIQLADNCLTNIKFITGAFPNLERIQLSRNYISDIDGIQKLARLVNLNLRNNRLSILPDQICNLHLENLNIRFNCLKFLPDLLGNLPLRKLQCDNNKLQRLPQSFQNLKKIRFLDFSKNQLKQIPQYFKDFLNLKQLLLTKNKIQVIPDWIGNLKSLINLNLGQCPVKNLPISLFELTNLEFLSIKTTVDQFPPEIGKLEKLQQLALNLPNVSSLPLQITKLAPKLIKLRLEDCKIKEFPKWITQMKRVQDIVFINNDIDMIPQQIQNVQTLRSLRIQSQKLSTLPQSFQKLTELRILSLARNKFKEIPKQIRLFKKLHNLSLQMNEIEAIDDDYFCEMIALQTLELKQNKIVKIPSSIQNLKFLKRISLGQQHSQEQNRIIDKIQSRNST